MGERNSFLEIKNDYGRFDALYDWQEGDVAVTIWPEHSDQAFTCFDPAEARRLYDWLGSVLNCPSSPTARTTAAAGRTARD